MYTRNAVCIFAVYSSGSVLVCGLFNFRGVVFYYLYFDVGSAVAIFCRFSPSIVHYPLCFLLRDRLLQINVSS